MNTANDHQQHAFHRFSLALYGAEGVEAVCLDLQDRFGLDINLVLLCCWVGRHGVRLSDESLRQAEQSVVPWRETAIDPLRRLRRRLKEPVGPILPDHASGLRELVKQAELMAEFVQQDYLVMLLEHLPGQDGRQADRGGVIRGNLLRYAALKSLATEDIPRQTLETLIDQALSVLLQGSPG